MLALGRRLGDILLIGDDVRITLCEIRSRVGRRTVQAKIEAAPGAAVLRILDVGKTLMIDEGEDVSIRLRDGRLIRLVIIRVYSIAQVSVGVEAPRDVIVLRSEQLAREQAPGAAVASG